MKKTIIIISIIVAVVLLAGGVWYFFLRVGAPVGGLGGGLPFGSGDGIDFPTPTLPEEAGPAFGVEDGRPVAKLFRVTDAPVAGAVVLGTGTSTTVRYVDRATGHIYDSNLITLDTDRITNTTLPKIYEAHFHKDGSMALLRTLGEGDVIENMSMSLTPRGEGEFYSVSTTLLRGNVADVAVGDGDVIYLVLEDTNSIISSTFDGRNQKTLFSSDFDNWRVSPMGSSLLIWTKAAAGLPGYAYSLNTANGSLTKLAGPNSGLTALADPTGQRFAITYNQTGQVKVVVDKLGNGESHELLPVTLVEKCAWGDVEDGVLFCGAPISGVGSSEPDGWYRGLTQYSDRIWRFDTENDTSRLLVDPKRAFNYDLDVSNIKLSQDEGYLVFVNRNDLSLWALKLD